MGRGSHVPTWVFVAPQPPTSAWLFCTSLAVHLPPPPLLSV